MYAMPTKTKRATKAKKPIKSKKTLGKTKVLTKRAVKKAVKKAVNKAFKKAVKKGGEGISIAPMAATEQPQDGPQPESGPATPDPTGAGPTQQDPSELIEPES